MVGEEWISLEVINVLNKLATGYVFTYFITLTQKQR